MAEEANIPAENAGGAVENTEQKAPEKDTTPDKSGEQAAKKEESSTVSEEQHQKLVEAWKEDREYFQADIKRLRAEVKSPEYTREEEAELEELTGIERDRKVVEFHKKREKAAEEAQLQAVKSEIRFYERTDKEFAENKKDILKVAQDYDCPNLKQAILVWRGLNTDKVKKDAQYHDNRKKEADGKAGGKAGGTTAGKPYDPKTDGKKSFGDFYREAGL